MFYIDTIETPIGLLYLEASDIGLTRISINDLTHIVSNPNAFTELAKKELLEYFDGKLTIFTVLLDLNGYTDFSYKVWMELLNIPFGKTISYKTLAMNLGNVKCIRAAGTANGRNPIPIIVPCHRVIGSDGSLTGYALGLEVKKRLLVIENADFNHANQLALQL